MLSTANDIFVYSTSSNFSPGSVYAENRHVVNSMSNIWFLPQNSSWQLTSWFHRLVNYAGIPIGYTIAFNAR